MNYPFVDANELSELDAEHEKVIRALSALDRLLDIDSEWSELWADEDVNAFDLCRMIGTLQVEGNYEELKDIRPLLIERELELVRKKGQIAYRKLQEQNQEAQIETVTILKSAEDSAARNDPEMDYPFIEDQIDANQILALTIQTMVNEANERLKGIDSESIAREIKKSLRVAIIRHALEEI